MASRNAQKPVDWHVYTQHLDDHYNVMKVINGTFYVDSYDSTRRHQMRDTDKTSLNGHLFRFTTKSNGTLKAVEVATYPAWG